MTDDQPCAQKKTAEDITAQAFAEQIGKVADEMGLDAKCKSSLQVDTNELVKAGQGDIGMGLILQSQGGDTETTMNSLQQSEGCGTSVLNAAQIMASRENINCALSESSNSTETSASSSATVKIASLPGGTYRAEAQETVDKIIELNKTVEQRAATVLSLMYMQGEKVDAIKYIELSRASVERQLQTAIDEMEKIGNVTVRNSKISVEAGVEIREIKSLTTEAKTTLDTEFKNIAAAAAETDIKKKLGPNASDSSIKAACMQSVKNEEFMKNVDMMKVVNQSKIEVTGEAEITIFAARELLLENVTIDAKAAVNIATEMVMQSALSAGRNLSSKLMSDSLTKTEEELESEGLDLAALKKAQMDGVAAQLANLTDGSNSSMMLMVLGGIVGVFVLMKLGGGRGGGGGGGGTVVVGGGAKGGGGGVFSIKSIQEEQNMRTAALIAGAGVSFANSVAIVAMLGCDNVPKTKKYAIGLFEWMQMCLLVVDFGEFVPGVAKGEVKFSLLAPAALACLVLHVMMRVPYTLPLSVALGTFGTMGPEYVASVLKVIKSERCDTDKMKTLILGNTPAAAAGFMAVAYGLRWVG